ncbi:MAG: 23S rRNA (adenine(2503)-C(2))-methyltransferase RlmN [Saccharofermentans sp.]|jgi:23S rRNA (adenine2503-C2)-methyltransferase|nr:23S rRNA (adenine(2503)-C(2))-methyltransferase RlmN [Mageeibacillus sp.]MCI1263372.1 23S rRNA (adenine(2503)-C(2))-methyltransferase RlmN [Saccharofermentans sp.]MCI1275914.1 23S rRNA (adenine(2503)-C(2))-methyltransferase RlmN [Saccharofermentans sp.]MCI1769040.1 23S rRNA (adenine(2503)-C(2))-methyltransferase RlmN [Mageeibacillus sp.]MCI2043968.1 23S rRNA (adenine(2503)-C(2))-methyltransferase RlmN [Mageeibacillus sp.]
MSDKFCLDLTHDELKTWCREKNIPAFRADQIYRWLSSGVINLDEMTNIPLSLRQMLDADFVFGSMTCVRKLVSEIDGTVKFVYRLTDGNVIETVVMRYRTGLSICISSQAGCKMGCSFCASAKLGFGRSLTSGEMFAQVILSQREVEERIRSVVVMGIGEPFDNYDNLIGFIKLATDKDGLNLGARHITVSTCGIVPKIEEFTRLDSQVNLAISLHAPDDELRRELMPIAKAYSLDELIPACRDYAEKTHRRITFEYSLFAGVNDSEAHARALARLLKGMLCNVNLIAANEFPGSAYRRSSREYVRKFQETLETMGINVTLRREMGTDIMAACGQLRRGIEEDKK